MLHIALLVAVSFAPMRIMTQPTPPPQAREGTETQADVNVVEVAGFAVLLTGSTVSASTDLIAALGNATPTTLAADLNLHCHPGGVIVPNRPADRIVQHVSCWLENGEQVVAIQGGKCARIGLARAVLDPGTGGGVRGVHALLLPVLALLVAQEGLCLAHSGALRCADGAALVLGASGQGKSTVVTAALSADRLVLGDDLAVLRLDGRGVSVAGVPQPLALPADLAREAAVGPAIAGDPRDRRSPACPAVLDMGWHPLSAVILVGHSAEPSGLLNRASGRDAFYRLLTSTLDGLSQATARFAFPFAVAVARLPAWQLGLAADPSARLAAVARNLTEVEAAVRAAPVPAE